ncbi:hybrid sensor histidine kinase/response regulator [Pacificispira sp.]|uniref:hybrid sensor histidine kinase/response regulator n=1 Tax=Pacificispira sp. TaxID=2888761 RepID=UPI003BA87C64
MDDLLSEFLTETAESMDVLDTELIKLEQNPNDQAILSNIFRLVHTIKGTCGFLGLPRLEAVAHASENVLGRIRDGELDVSPAAVSLVLESLDQIKLILKGLEQTEAEPEGDDTDLIQRLNHLAETGEVPGADNAPAAAATSDNTDEEDAAAAAAMEAEASKTAVGSAAFDAMLNSDEVAEDSPELQAAFDNAVYKGPGDPMAGKKAADSGSEPASEPEAEPEKANLPAPAPATAPAAKEAKAAEGAPPAEKKEGAGVIQTIRVNVDLLENLMTMVSELVLTRNQLLQILRSQGDSEFNAPLQRLSHVTSELQEGVMKTRMQPIGNAWAKLPRIVRDLSLELDKKIDLQMIGAETELDRQVLEIIKDPLTHMVRNSADHGIEMPAQRVASGKQETGTITLNAFHEGGHILIEIKDDGKGLAADKIKAKAISNGLATEAELDQMSEHQIQQFIFAAGFSTAAQVTSVSGRGVGMDVVKSNIDKIGGTVELKSIEGKGTTFTIKIPLTLAIVSALIVECGAERFAIPQISVVELVRASADAEHKIEMIHGTPVLRLRNRLLPLVNLRKLLDVEGAEDMTDLDEAFIVVSQVGAYTFGIIVDKIYDAEEIVVKPVSSLVRHIPIFAGNTILGDGSVIMILDPNGIAQSTGEIQVAEQQALETADARANQGQERVALLLFRADGKQPKAVPLALVARLEEINFDEVEYSNGRAMVQYRGSLMPLVPVNPNEKFPETGKKPTLVFSDRSRSMGLVVDEILDIVEDRLTVEHGATRDGFVGSAIVNGHATEIIDTAHYLTVAFPDWFGREKGGALETNTSQKQRILLVDDSAFFRNLLSPMLSAAGYAVTSVDSAEAALKLQARGANFDAIISDIEMPGMNGFELVEELRGGGRWSDLPIVAMSSHTTQGDLERGHEVGFTDYVAKHDRDGLLQALSETLSDGFVRQAG